MNKAIISNSFDRIGSFLSDYSIFCLPNIILFVSFCIPWASIIFPDDGLWPLYFFIIYAFPWLLPLAIFNFSTIAFLFLLSYCLAFSTSYFYFDSIYGGAFGKKKGGLKIVNLNESSLSFPKAFARNFIKYFFFVCCPFLLLPFWGGGTQGLHDKICATKVIKAPIKINNPLLEKRKHPWFIIVVLGITIVLLLCFY